MTHFENPPRVSDFSKNLGDSSNIYKNLSNFFGVSYRISQDGVY